MNEELVIILAGIGLLAIACQWLAWWVKLPAILFLLLSGIIAGPLTGWLDPAAVFGELLFPMVSLSVAVILFEGGLTLKLHEIKGVESVVRKMVTSGILITWAVTTVATRYAVGLSWELCLLFGAVTVVTGPTVIVPMLRTVRPTARIANILRWEGIVIDPIGALMAVLVYEYIISGKGDAAFGHTVMTLGATVLTGGFLGAAAGYAFGIVLRRHLLPEYLHNVASLTFVLGIYAASNHLQSESGLLAVTIMGMWLANMKDVPVDDILDFKESLSVILISALFITLAARIEFSELQELGWTAVWVFVAIQFAARPLKVFFSTLGSTLTWAERALLGWIAPRGVVAAAVSALFAIRLEQEGFENAALLAPLTFIVIIGTVVLQSATARPIAKLLGVAEPETKGFLIVGANTVARTIAKGLVDKDFRVLLADSNWDNISKARMDGLPVYHGNPISEHADRHMDMVGIGRMLALSPQGDLNSLAGVHYRIEFGRNSVYSLLTSAEAGAGEKHKTAAEKKGQTLFGEDVTYTKLSSLIGQGAEIKTTPLTESFDFESMKKNYGGKAIPLFAINPKGRIKIFTSDQEVSPEAGWTVTSLVNPETEVAPRAPRVG